MVHLVDEYSKVRDIHHLEKVLTTIYTIFVLDSHTLTPFNWNIHSVWWLGEHNSMNWLRLISIDKH